MIDTEFLQKRFKQITTGRGVLGKTYRTINTFVADINKTNLLTYASGMAYITLVSVVPSLAAMFAIISIFQPLADTDATWFEHFQNFILRNLTADAGMQTIGYLKSFLANLDVTRIGVTGFAFLLLTIIMLLRNIEIALNDIWQVTDTRPMFKRFIYFWTTITLGTLIATLSIGAVAEFNLANLIPFTSYQTKGMAIPFLPEVTTIVATLGFFGLIYKIGPNTHVHYKAALVGAVVATVLIRVAAAGYGLYITHSDWNQNIYGALAAVPLFLIWLYIVWMVILFGAIVSWRVQFGLRAKRDGTDSGALSASDARQCERNWQLRATVPLLCLFETLDRFNQASGHGITGLELANELDLPAAWVKEAILVVEQHGLIVLSNRHAWQSDEEDLLMHLEIFPAYPAKQIKVAELMNLLTHDASDWMSERQNRLDYDLGAVTEAILTAVATGDLDLSVDDLLYRRWRQSANAVS